MGEGLWPAKGPHDQWEPTAGEGQACHIGRAKVGVLLR